MAAWIDSHCHLDAPEFAADRLEVRARARAQGVLHCVIPAVRVADFAAVRALAQQTGDSYCLGIHPLYVAEAQTSDLDQLEQALATYRDDPQLVAVGEIGLDYFVPALSQSPLREKQTHFCQRQLQLARQFGLPVVLHVRRSADALHKLLRQTGAGPWQGIAHAFNGSAEQAQALLALGLKLGFGGAVSYSRALQLRRLASSLPLQALVLETDAPDMPPHWRYTPVAERAAGTPQGRNSPEELPQIAAQIAELRGITPAALAEAVWQNTLQALPKLAGVLV